MTAVLRAAEAAAEGHLDGLDTPVPAEAGLTQHVQAVAVLTPRECAAAAAAAAAEPPGCCVPERGPAAAAQRASLALPGALRPPHPLGRCCAGAEECEGCGDGQSWSMAAPGSAGAGREEHARLHEAAPIAHSAPGLAAEPELAAAPPAKGLRGPNTGQERNSHVLRGCGTSVIFPPTGRNKVLTLPYGYTDKCRLAEDWQVGFGDSPAWTEG